MSNELQIYRKRLIPEECILLKDDIIVEQNEDYILTKWKTLNANGPQRNDRYVFSFFQFSSFSYLNLLHWTFPVYQ